MLRNNNIFVYDEFSKINSYKLIKKIKLISYGTLFGVKQFIWKPSIIMKIVSMERRLLFFWFKSQRTKKTYPKKLKKRKIVFCLMAFII